MKSATHINNKHPELKTLARQLLSSGLPHEHREIYRGRNLVAACRFTADTEVNIKAFAVPGCIKSFIYGWMRKSKAQRSYENAIKLCDLGINTPEPLAYVLASRFPARLGRSYYISEQLGNEWQEIRFMEKRNDYKEMVEALAIWVAGVHAKGVMIKDLSPGNILFRKNGGGFEFTMVDVNRMSFDNTDLDKKLYRAGWLMNSEESSCDFARCYSAAAGLDSIHATNIVLTAYRKLQKRAKLKKKLRR